MNLMKIRRASVPSFVLAFAAITLVGSATQAGAIVNIRYVSRAPNAAYTSGGKVTLNGQSVNLSQGGGFYFEEAGAGTIDAAGLQTNADGLLLAFCIELTQDFSPSASSLTHETLDLKLAPQPDSGNLTDGMGGDKADMLRLLWTVGMEDDAAIADANSSAAFQLAIWKIMYDGLMVTSVPGPVSSLADSWITTATDLFDLGADARTAFMADLVALTSPSGQDFLAIQVPSPDLQTSPVPEPSSLLAWLLLGSAVGYGARRRHRDTK